MKKLMWVREREEMRDRGKYCFINPKYQSMCGCLSKKKKYELQKINFFILTIIKYL